MTKSKCTLIIDSGADISLFKLGKISPYQKINPIRKFNLTGVTEGTTETLGETSTNLRFYNNLTINHSFQIVSDNFPIPTDGILGRDFLVNFKCNINYETWILNINVQNQYIEIPIEDNLNNAIVIPARCEAIRRIPLVNYEEDTVVLSQEIQPGVFCGNTIVSPTLTTVKFVNTTNKQVLIHNFIPKTEPLKNFTIHYTKPKLVSHKIERVNKILTEIKIKDIPQDVQKPLTNLIKNYEDIFCLPDEHLPTNNFYTQHIELENNVPVYIPNYRTIHSQNEEITSQVQKLICDDIIEPSVSPYNSPILLVPKKSEGQDKKWRLVVDFRQLNKKVLADKFPLPRIDEILDQLGRARYFSTLDLMAGFHQIPLDPESRKFTAFSTNTGHYQFKRLPFGLNISPNSFQRMMNIAMAGLTPEIAFIYIDDIVIIGCSENHHINNLTEVFKRLRHYNLKLNPSKCKFFQTEVVYLGHKITDKGILPDDSKFDTLMKYPVPKNSDEVRRFVAFCNYYRKFVENFASIAHPLNQLLRKDTKFIWSTQCQQAFDYLRYQLMTPKILQYPDFNNKFILTTDASDIGCGAVLSQITDKGDLPVAFASKTFTPGEKNKAVILKELTAIHWAINYFRPYLYGRRFTVRTDHRPLVYLFKIKDPTSKLTRMRLDLEEFDFDVIYIRGKENVGADALSRIVLTSEQLKQNNILVVNTRSMTKKAESTVNKTVNKPVVSDKLDQLCAYTTENPSETEKNVQADFKH